MALPALPAPITWAEMQVISAPQLRSDVSDAVAFLSARPMLVGQQSSAGQSIGSGLSSPVAVQIDTELYDNWHGHQDSGSAASAPYWAQIAGAYMVETSIPLAYTAGADSLSALVGGSQGGGSLTWYGGMKTGNNSGQDTTATAAKLMLMSDISAFGTGDYLQAGVVQDSGSSRSLSNTASRRPQVTARWVSALSGTEPLIVPENEVWAFPPAYVTSAFLNQSIRDTINFLIYPPVMEVPGTSGGSLNLASQTSVPATGTVIGCGVPSFDNYSAWSNSGNIWTAPVGGTYWCYGQVGLTVGAHSVSMAAGLTVTSANYNSGTTFTMWGGAVATVVSSAQCMNVRRRLRLNAGDTVQLAGFQRDSTAAAASINTSGFWVPRLIIIWEAQ
jgi:hypothetical protein